MGHPEHTHAQIHSHPHTLDCACHHDKIPLKLYQRRLLTALIVGILLIVARPFVLAQMFVRVTSYSSNKSYQDAVRVCKKMIFLDKDSRQAWTSLGYAYRDMSQADLAKEAFEKVLDLDPGNKGAASFELGELYFGKGDLSRAVGYFERVRSAGPRAGTLLDADILKYRHGILGFRSVNSLQTLLGDLLECYKRTGNTVKAEAIQKELDFYKNRHSRVLF